MPAKRKSKIAKSKTIQERNAKKAEVVTPSMPIFSIADMRKVDKKDFAEIYSASALAEYAAKISSKGARWKCMKLFNLLVTFGIAIEFDKWIQYQPHIKKWLEYEQKHYMAGKNVVNVQKAQKKMIASQNLQNYV